jgi:predicted O-linked N-acetylglucosamine transferase (SPINDLY family)
MANDLNQTLQLAQATQSAGKPAEALALYQQVLAAAPEHIELQIACGNLCVETGQFAQAASHFRNVFTRLQQQRDARANHAREALCYALSAQGNAAHALGDFKTAATCHAEATRLNPQNAAYWYNLGNAQRELGDNETALRSYQTALKQDPSDADTHNNLGNTLRALGRLDEAIAAYEMALKLKPDLYHALAHLIHQKQHICDWRALDAQIATLRNAVRNASAHISPFAFLAMPGTTAAEQLQCASQWNAHFLSPCEPISMRLPGHAKKRIHVAYLSADFRQHPLAYLITDLLAAHDRAHFAISAYVANRPDGSAAEMALKQAVDHWVDISQLNDAKAAQKIADDGVDILVDLTGFTQNSRSMVAAYRPAKAHINWLGYPGTMGIIGGGILKGAPLFDYLIADDVLIAPEEEKYYAEKIIRLPCYQPNNRTRPVAEAGSRAAHGLPKDAFVFCSFNQTFKITPDVFAIWMRLLKSVPNSVLWLMDCNRWARVNLQAAAQAAGVDTARLIFAPRANIDAHLGRHAHADLFLDTLPYNAHTTASDALYMGLPIITCKGDTLSARVAASLLNCLKLDELISDTLESYAQCAMELAKQPLQLRKVKEKLALQLQSSDLYKPEAFVRQLEAEYRHIVQE